MIMRIGWVTGSAYEWTNHWRVATTAGIPPEDLLAVRNWRNSDRLTAADRAILAATDECLEGKSISDAVWTAVRHSPASRTGRPAAPTPSLKVGTTHVKRSLFFKYARAVPIRTVVRKGWDRASGVAALRVWLMRN